LSDRKTEDRILDERLLLPGADPRTRGDTVVKKYLEFPKQLPRREFKRRAEKILEEIQKTLLPEHAAELVAINVETGEYTLGHTPHEAVDAFRRRWPDQLSYLVRVDGGPVVKFHGK
jgi:hypothetical protein